MINLGDSVRDEVTGFKGVVLARTEALYEATMCRVHARELGADGRPNDSIWFEEDRLVVIEKHAVIGFRNIAGVMAGSEVKVTNGD